MSFREFQSCSGPTRRRLRLPAYKFRVGQSSRWTQQSFFESASNSALEDHLGKRLFLGVRNGQSGILDAQLRGKLLRLTMKLDCWTPSGQAHDLAIAPAHTVVPAGSKRLHRRFLRRKACGIALCSIGFGIAVAPLPCRIHAFQETLPKAFYRLLNTWDFCDIDSRANDHPEFEFYSKRSPR